MIEEHWFDTRARILARGVPRRSALRSATVGTAGLLLGALPDVEAGKKKQQGKKNKQKGTQQKGKGGKQKAKRKRPPPPPTPEPAANPAACRAGACEAFDTPEDRDWCEFICQQCDASDPREFCLVGGPPFNPARVAVCCVEGATCCHGQCCSSMHGSPGNRCCPGGGCVDTSNDPQHCGGCGNACPSGQSCLDGACPLTCPAGTEACPYAYEDLPRECCNSAACIICTRDPTDPRNPDLRRCVYRCGPDQVCRVDQPTNRGYCRGSPGARCAARVHCCSRQCGPDRRCV